MKFKPKGRKIYRYQTRGERVRAFFKSKSSVFATILGIVCLVFVGYSVGGPVLRFLEEREIITKKPPESKAETSPSVSDTQSAPESSDSAVDSVESAAVTEPQEAVTLPEMHVYMLEQSALASGKALQEALEALPADATHAAVMLKSKGGSLHYATEIADVSGTSAVVSVLPAETICAAIETKGLVPVAVINAFEDHVYPRTFSAAGYQIAGSGERWLDNSPENGGKPWLSPLSAIGVDYLETLVDEIADAGFPVILCEGLTFPDFSEEDLTMLDPRAGAPDRSTFLASAVNAMQEAARGTMFLVKMDGEAVLDHSEPVYASAGNLSADAIVVSVENEAELEAAAAELEGFACIPMMDTAGEEAQSWFVEAQEPPAPTEPPASTEE